MFLYPSSQYLNNFQESDRIPEKLEPLCIPGFTGKLLCSANVQLLTQSYIHPEFELRIHHVFAKHTIELYGKTIKDGSVYFVQHRGETSLLLSQGSAVNTPEGECLLFFNEGQRQNRFTVNSGETILLFFQLTSAGEQVISDYYPDLAIDNESNNGGLLSANRTYFLRYRHETLLQPIVPQDLLKAFFAEQLRGCLLELCILLRQPTFRTEIKREHYIKADQVRMLIEKDPGKHWTLKELSKQTNWNVQALKMAFKAIFNVTPHQFLLQERMKFALAFVQGSEQPIKTISRTCGFRRSHHFIRVFKKYYGMTPSKYRYRT